MAPLRRRHPPAPSSDDALIFKLLFFRVVFRYLEAGLDVGADAFGVIAPAAFLAAMFPAFVSNPLLDQPLVLHVGLQLAMMFALTGLPHNFHRRLNPLIRFASFTIRANPRPRSRLAWSVVAATSSRWRRSRCCRWKLS